MIGWNSPGRTRDCTKGTAHPRIACQIFDTGQWRSPSPGQASSVRNSGCWGKTGCGSFSTGGGFGTTGGIVSPLKRLLRRTSSGNEGIRASWDSIERHLTSGNRAASLCDHREEALRARLLPLGRRELGELVFAEQLLAQLPLVFRDLPRDLL